MHQVRFAFLLMAVACGDDSVVLFDSGAAFDTRPDTFDGEPDVPSTFDAGQPDVPATCMPMAAQTENVSIEGGVGTLGGTLEVPAGCPPFAVVIMISGTGTTDRDGNADGFGANQYAMLAEAMGEAGVATLRFDDHGIGESAGAAPSIEDFRFDLEIEDAARWVTRIREDERFDRVLFAGHSQGSLTAMLASQAAPIDGIVSLSGTSLPGGQLLLEQASGNISPSDYADLENAVEELEAGRTIEELPASLRDVLPLYLQPYLISWFRFDPREQAALVKAPTLVLHGDADGTVPVTHADTLAEALGNEALIIANMAHNLKYATRTRESQRAAATDPSVRLADGLVDAIVTFIAP